MNNIRRLLFRCDGGQAHGLGHLTRCLSLARAVREVSPQVNITFWGSYDAFASQLLKQYEIPILTSPLPEATACGVEATLVVCAEFDALLLDSYSFDQDYIDGLKRRSFKLALIDDDQRHDLSDADLVVCFRAGAETYDYGARHQLLGPKFMLVKPELRALRERNLTMPLPRAIRHVLVFLSGGDLGTEFLPTVLGALDGMDLDIAYLSTEKCALGEHFDVQHLTLNPAIESYYAQADFVICGGGLTKYECAYAGIANACLSLTALQDEDTQLMAAQGFTLDLGPISSLCPEQLARQLKGFIKNQTMLKDQRKAVEFKLDGEGPLRVARKLLNL